MFSVFVTSVGQKKILRPQGESNSDVLPLSHRDSMASKAHYEVLIWHVSCILLGSAISKASGLVKNKKDGKFWAWWRNIENCFLSLSRAWDKEKILSAHEESELRNGPCQPLSQPQRLYGEGIGARNPSYGLRIFSFSHARDKDRKLSIFLHRVQNLPSFLFFTKKKTCSFFCNNHTAFLILI